MTNNENKYVLKGQHNLAQGNALGLKADEKIVRAMTFLKGQLLLWTKRMDSCFPENNESQFRPKDVFCIDPLFPADGFRYAPFTQGDVSVVPPETLPWAEISWPFRPGKYIERNLYININISKRGEGVRAFERTSA